jgi:hypothetical protein
MQITDLCDDLLEKISEDVTAMRREKAAKIIGKAWRDRQECSPADWLSPGKRETGTQPN